MSYAAHVLRFRSVGRFGGAVLLLLAVLLAACCPPGVGFAAAQAPPEARVATWTGALDEERGFALEVPVGHVLARGAGPIWYVHGFLDDDPDTPLVPDVRLNWSPEATVASWLEANLPDAEIVGERRLGPGTSAVRVLSRWTMPDDVPVEEDLWLAPHPDGGVLAVVRYEGFDWDGYDTVATGLRWTRPATRHGSGGP